MLGKKTSVGDSVAAAMNSIMGSESYQKTFAGPQVVIKSAAKKKDEEEEEEKAKGKNKAKDMAEKKEKKPSKKKAYVEAVNGLNKIAEIFDNLGLEKSAYAATRALMTVVKESQEMGDALYADDNDALTHDHEHTHSDKNPEACHRHPDLGFADDEYSEEDKKTLKELEEAFGGPEKMQEMVEKGQFADLFDENKDDDEIEGPSGAELLGGDSPLANIMDDVDLPEGAGSEPVELEVGPELKEKLIEALEGMDDDKVEFVYNLISRFGINPEDAVEKADMLAQKMKEENEQMKGASAFRIRAMIAFAPLIKSAMIKQASLKKKAR